MPASFTITRFSAFADADAAIRHYSAACCGRHAANMIRPHIFCQPDIIFAAADFQTRQPPFLRLDFVFDAAFARLPLVSLPPLSHIFAAMPHARRRCFFFAMLSMPPPFLRFHCRWLISFSLSIIFAIRHACHLFQLSFFTLRFRHFFAFADFAFFAITLMIFSLFIAIDTD